MEEARLSCRVGRVVLEALRTRNCVQMKRKRSLLTGETRTGHEVLSEGTHAHCFQQRFVARQPGHVRPAQGEREGERNSRLEDVLV